MAKESFIKKLLDRRVPQILGSYLVAATSLVLFVEYLVDKYQFQNHYPTLALFAIIGILPSVIILAYFHGAPGKDAWTKVEKIGIPINALFITICLLFGDHFGLWDISSSQKRHVFYIGSLDKAKEYLQGFSSLQDAKAQYGEIEILNLNNEELDEISLNVESNLLNEFYNQNVEIDFLTKDNNHRYINDLLNENGLWNTAIDVYESHNHPDQCSFIFIYKTIINDSPKLFGFGYGFIGDPSDARNWEVKFNSLLDKEFLIDKISEDLKHYIKIVNINIKFGLVTQVDGDIIIFNPMGLKLKKNMKLIGFTQYNLVDNNNNGKIENNEGKQKKLDDIKRAIDYAEHHPNEYSQGMINEMKLSYDKWTNFHGIADGQTSELFSYTLKVIKVTESTVVAKIVDLNYPWVKVRENDFIMLE